jgi:hypothetical protein
MQLSIIFPCAMMYISDLKSSSYKNLRLANGQKSGITIPLIYQEADQAL